jgi:adenosylmethionine---8-amino-7-oxononanoate aminotransferase
MTNLLELDKKNIWHPFTPLLTEIEPLLITSAEGVYLNTSDNRKIIDAISSWWVNLHGHSHPYIAEAIATQAKKLEHVIFAGFTHEPAIKLSENLLSILPNTISKIFFSDNGSTSVEVALKMAMQYWHNQDINRKGIIAIDGAYHGDTFGSMAIGERSIFSKPFADYLFDVDFIDFPTQQNEEEVFTAFKTKIDSQNVGVFIYEPLVQGASGMRMYSASFLDKLIAYAQQHHVICIADEVFTGFGRTGKLFASDYLKTTPDIMAVSKGITGGSMPLGVTAVSHKIIKAFQTNDFLKTFFHGHSYTANPLACAAANASFDLLMKTDCQTNIQRISAQHLKTIDTLKNRESIKEIRSLGTILAIELNSPQKSSYSNSLRNEISNFFMKNNILLRPLGNIFYMVPPYCITNEQLEFIYQKIDDFTLALNR